MDENKETLYYIGNQVNYRLILFHSLLISYSPTFSPISAEKRSVCVFSLLLVPFSVLRIIAFGSKGLFSPFYSLS